MFFAAGRVGRQTPVGSGWGGPRPSLDLSLSGPALDSRITFTRAAGPATYFDVAGVMQTAGTNVPRFDYDPVTHALRGLLIEEARTNPVLNSGALATLIPSGSLLTATSGIAPDGTNTMARIAEDGGTSIHLAVSASVSITPGSNYTLSVFARAQQNRYLQLFFDDTGANGIFATFDLQTGTVSGAVTARGLGTAVTAQITMLSNSTWRCAIVGTAGPGAGAARCGISLSNVATPVFAPSYASNVANGLLVWGLQAELGTFPTSYIPTTGAPVTRPADIAWMPVGPWFNAAAGTLATEYDGSRTGRTEPVCGFGDGSTANMFYLKVNGQTTATVASVNKNIVLGTPSATPAVNKIASAYRSGSFYGSLNGAAVVTDNTLAAGPYLWSARLSIGCSPWNLDTQMCGWISRIRYWPRALSAAELVIESTPSQDASLELDFLNNTLDSRITFTRAAGPATYFNSAGVLQTAGTNVARFDYNPATLVARGLLVEEARTNVILNSGDFTNATWSKTTCTLAAGIPGPNGATTGSGVISNSGVTGYLPGITHTPTAGTAYTMSVFAKAGSLSNVVLLMPSTWWADATVRNGNFNLITGVVASSTGSGASATITPVGSGWYRISLTATPDIAAAAGVQFARATANGDGTTVQHYAFGAQLEASAFITSYIPTASAAATRAADIATMAIAGWLNLYAGTLSFEYDTLRTAATTGVQGGMSDGTFGNSFYATHSIGSASWSGAGGNIGASGTPNTAGSRNKAACAYATTTMSASLNGAVPTGAVIGAAPFAWTTKLNIGCSPWGDDGQICGHVSRVCYWPRALSAAQLQTETT